MKILFVCTGNTCRSPLAEVMARARLAAAGLDTIEVASAGVAPFPDAPASEGSYLVAMEHGLDLGGHRARELTPELVAAADLVLTMGRSHLARAIALGGQDKSHLLGAWAGAVGRDQEVPDPIGGPLDEYRATRDHLATLLDAAIARLRDERGG